MGDSEERAERLTGGFQSDVVRIGDTVRRPVRQWTPAVHALLRHLERAGFDGTPRVVGLDDHGREVLTYVDGVAAAGAPLPAYVWSDETLASVGRLVRGMHDATRRFVGPPGARWQTPRAGSGPLEVMCHNDIAPWNTVFRDGSPVAFIDWDSASPGAAVWDLAYAAWQWVPLWEDNRALSHGFTELGRRAARLALLCRAYGLTPSDRPNFVEVIEQRIAWQRAHIVRGAQEGNPADARLVQLGAVDGIRNDQALVARLRDQLSLADSDLTVGVIMF